MSGLKKYMNEAEANKPVWVFFKELEEFEKSLEGFVKLQKAKIVSGDYADRMDSRERDSISAAKNFVHNVEKMKEHLEYLKRNMRNYYGRDLDIGR